ncbi:uncharacterized protein [Miscanthus floridulus]|uniref:uncharacterized protein isoform X1 n=1 Tax=Miscanthus floridulus TaxID=154761 RepID=UPI0034592939
MPSPPPPLASLCRARLVLVPALLLLPSMAHGVGDESARALSVGEELVAETMPLRHGRRVYRIDGLRPSAWYEVKISYPASIPSSFSIQLLDNWSSKNRRLLNTEKIIFKAESSNPVYVLVTVEPEGVVAKPNVPERELALFNIGTVVVFLYNSFRSSFMISEIKLVKHVTNFIKSMYELCESLGIPVQNYRMNQPFEPRQALCISKFGSSILDACYTQFI